MNKEMTEGNEMFELHFEEKDLIACLMDPIITWNDTDRLEELCQAMTAGSKEGIEEEYYEEYKIYIKKTLKDLNERLGYG